jgi:outer membrane lipopolysaccharide assembly protein LptE/RlpB
VRTVRWGSSLVLAAALALAGCGYEFVRYRTAPGDLRSVAVRPLRNDSVDAGYGRTVTDAILREILRRGALRVAADSADADLVLSGRVNPIDTNARSFDSIVLALEYEVRVSLDLTVAKRDGSEYTLPSETVKASERYTASADVEALRKNREEALRRVATLLASRVHDSLSESF